MMQLLCIVVAALAIPTALCHNGWLEKRLRLREPKLKPVMRASAGIQDAAGGQKRLRQESPEWILVGNSMLNCRVDNAELEALTGHPVGGVCPFGLATPLPIYLDRSLQDFDEVLPAAGSVNSALRISPASMAELTGGQWVDACQ